MNISRLRMVAGPNGSGKSSLTEDLSRKYRLGYYLNPDVIELALKTTGSLDFSAWGLKVQPREMRKFIEYHPLGAEISSVDLAVDRNRLHVPPSEAGGYVAAIVCDFMRRRWLPRGVSFTFETVMSSSDKVHLLRRALRKGYRTYLYFVCTESPLINVERVEARMRDGGHAVPKDKIVSRYGRSLALLKMAISCCSRAFIFDNSASNHPLQLVAEYQESKLMRCTENPPAWFIESVLASQ